MYFIASVLCYLGGSFFLQISEATFFNLSLLTGDLWSVAFSVIAEKIIPGVLFFVALMFILSGVVLYEMAPSPVLEDREKEVRTSLEGTIRTSAASKPSTAETIITAFQQHSSPQRSQRRHRRRVDHHRQDYDLALQSSADDDGVGCELHTAPPPSAVPSTDGQSSRSNVTTSQESPFC